MGMNEKEIEKATACIAANRALALGVSTRGVGFGTQMLANTAVKYNDAIKVPDINKMYRVFLGVVEGKIQSLQNSDIIDEIQHTRGEGLEQPLLDRVGLVARIPEPIGRIVSNIGIVTHNEETFVPCLPKDVVDNEHRLVPTPETVVLSNLRRTVETLANPDTPVEYRTNFRAKNPIPGTRWSQEDVLLNPDDIIPPDYNIRKFNDDNSDITPFVNQLEKYIPKLAGGLSKFKDKRGSKAQFISTTSANIKQPELGENEDRKVALQELYYKIPEGDAELFWSRYSVNSVEKLLGVVALMGEVPTNKRMADPLFTFRRSQCCSKKYRVPYIGATSLYFGL